MQLSLIGLHSSLEAYDAVVTGDRQHDDPPEANQDLPQLFLQSVTPPFSELRRATVQAIEDIQLTFGAQPKSNFIIPEVGGSTFGAHGEKQHRSGSEDIELGVTNPSAALTPSKDTPAGHSLSDQTNFGSAVREQFKAGH